MDQHIVDSLQDGIDRAVRVGLILDVVNETEMHIKYSIYSTREFLDYLEGLLFYSGNWQ